MWDSKFAGWCAQSCTPHMIMCMPKKKIWIVCSIPLLPTMYSLRSDAQEPQENTGQNAVLLCSSKWDLISFLMVWVKAEKKYCYIFWWVNIPCSICSLRMSILTVHWSLTHQEDSYLVVMPRRAHGEWQLLAIWWLVVIVIAEAWVLQCLRYCSLVWTPFCFQQLHLYRL
jgi:hypothetical protein